MALPVLYSLRNCPYAMRARMAIFKAKLVVELRDLVLSNKPAEMITASPKGTVPTLVLPTSTVIDESLDVMLWAFNESDPDNLLSEDTKEASLALVSLFDQEFKPSLEAYKCAKRYHEDNLLECRETCENYIVNLEKRLSQHDYLIDNNERMADIAILPFIRQFAKVERQWYLQSPYPNVRRWLNGYLQSVMFNKVMTKYPLWKPNHEVTKFGDI